MDVKIEYKLATHKQIKQTFNRFFERQFVSTVGHLNPSQIAGPSKPRKEHPILMKEEVDELSVKFADQIPEDTFSLAQVQGFLLTKKMDARGAAEHVSQWVREQLEERQKIKDLKEKKKRNKEKREQERKERERKERDAEKADENGIGVGKNGVNGTNGKAINGDDHDNGSSATSDKDD